MAKKDGVRFLNGAFQRALIIEHPDPSLDDYLRAQGIEPERLPKEATMDRKFVIDTLNKGQHDLIFKRSRFEVDQEVLDASDNLAAVQLCCIGDDSVDKVACAKEGVLVLNDPISNGRSVVELVFGELICLARRIFDAVEKTQASEWTKDNIRRYELKGKTLGILGLGNIGKAVAQMAERFDMDVVFYDSKTLAREVGTTLGWEACQSIDEVFRKSDFVTVHFSATDYRGTSNENILSYSHFEQMGADRGENSPRIFLNLSRGFLFEPDELKQAVRDGKVRYASVDVFPEEPGSGKDAWENPYSDIPEIVGTPHIGAATQEAQPRIARHVSNTIGMLNTFGTVRDSVYAPGQVIRVDGAEPPWVLAVCHSDARGTKKAVSDAIFDAGLNNLESAHRDFKKYGFAYDLNGVDEPLSIEQLEHLVATARDISGDPTAIRSIRMIKV